MPAKRTTLLCHYRYDALDRLTGQGLTDAPPLQRFYCKSRLATEIQGALRQTLFQHDDWLLAQQQQQGVEHDTLLLATDQQRSVLNTLKANHQAQPIAYAPYGHRQATNGWMSLMGFNGERPDPLTGHYLLGNGYRAFNPVLMRFNSPDSLSPFGKGGLNSYAYCLGDPINFSDNSGRVPSKFTALYLFRAQKSIKRTLSVPELYISDIAKVDFFAFHGTGKTQARKLIKEGVLLRNTKLKGDQRGFFGSPDISTTYEYARKQELKNTNIKIPTHQIYEKDNIVEIHVRNLTSMKQGIDYDYNFYELGHPIKRDSMEFFIANHKSRAIEIRALGDTSEPKKIRLRSHEAPF
ncbi:RHS repeat-associated core domain-containing protein [Pseudomonas mohnii]|uniref:RHS repeat-associated core domain-containing protein n=1 Tax=Pseudomonas mohnii TaxID=395600 RepID=A0ABY0XP83_9PSED|nr:RHS repeat-associated core domain-containing protein [Pseudomonas mohnii]SEB80712.1 RHS repeat-associated core domain-containing protein [Pseudomonas mohnii]